MCVIFQTESAWRMQKNVLLMWIGDPSDLYVSCTGAYYVRTLITGLADYLRILCSYLRAEYENSTLRFTRLVQMSKINVPRWTWWRCAAEYSLSLSCINLFQYWYVSLPHCVSFWHNASIQPCLEHRQGSLCMLPLENPGDQLFKSG